MVLTNILFISSVCLGLFLLGEEGMLLHGVKKWLQKKFTYIKVIDKDAQYPKSTLETRKIFKVIWGCPPCMASVWGSLLYWAIQGFTMNPTPEVIFWYVPTILGASFVNALLWNMYDR